MVSGLCSICIFTEYFQALYKSEEWKEQCVIAQICSKGTFICQASLKQGIFFIYL